MNLKTITKLLFAIFFLTATVAVAGPATRVKRIITLADGTQKSVTLCGDENIHFYLDDQGNTYIDEGNGHIAPCNKNEVKARWNERLAANNKRRLERGKARGMITAPQLQALSRSGSKYHKSKWGAESNPISGKKKGLVLLVNFQDNQFDSTHNQAFFDGYFNEEGFSKQGLMGSVHDYFYECSYGQFDLTFDVVGPITVSKKMAYYGQNYQGVDMYPAEMITEACYTADSQGIDFSRYDWDGDGEVDQVYVIYAGYGENMGGDKNTLWAHESSLESAKPYGDGNGAITIDGVKVNTYALSSELCGDSGNIPAGIGNACHEFSHCMCLPDMYDINSVFMGMFAWDLMDYGSYSGIQIGECPAPYTSYERMYCGWLTPKVLSEPCIVKDMPCIHDEPMAYILYNEGNKNEYYMLENRQRKGFSKYDPGHGLLITHVLYDPEVWINNMVNSTELQHMTIIPADGKFDMYSAAGDTWPGTSNKTALTDHSTPAATLYTANSDGSRYMGKPIEDIEERNGLISFVFDGGMVLTTPVASDATNVTPNSFTAQWLSVAETSDYELMLTTSDINAKQYAISDVAIMEEDFRGFNNGTEKNGIADVSVDLDSYTIISGWEGQNIYTTPRNEIRLGNPYAGGQILSPWLHTDTKVVTVAVTVRSYSSDTEPVYLVMGEGEEGGPVASIPLSKEPVQIVVTASSDTNDWWFGLVCDARCYVSEMSAYEGHLTEEQVAAGYVTTQLTESELYSVTGTSREFTDLSADKKYSYKVRAVLGNSHSPWSNQIDVTLPADGADGIATITTENAKRHIIDISGRTLAGTPLSGIHIINGRKIWNK